MSLSEKNPVGLRGVDFVEYVSPDAKAMDALFVRLGFKKVAAHKKIAADLYRQGQVNFMLNREPGTFAQEFSKKHGPSICSVGFLVDDAKQALDAAVKRGARVYKSDMKTGTPFLAMYGIGDSLIYFIDDKTREQFYKELFGVTLTEPKVPGFGLERVDHFTNNVPKGEMEKWVQFYEKVFGFKEIRFFDIRGAKTGLLSRAMGSPCGTFAVPINEPTESKSQIQEYLDEYKGSGIQHLAFLTKDIVKTLETMKESRIQFLTPPPKTYYAMLKNRLPNMDEDVETLEKNAVLADGDEHGYLLQIFTKNMIGPIFFELIQRENHHGFGDGNFQALFDAIERDQKERGYLT